MILNVSSSYVGFLILFAMGVARIFFGGGTHFQKNFKKYSKKFVKNFVKIFNKVAKNFQKYSKKLKKFLKKFLKFSKNFHKNLFTKMLKIHYFSIFFKKVNKPCVQFLRVWTKSTNSLKILKRFRKKIAKNELFTLAPAGIFSGGG